MVCTNVYDDTLIDTLELLQGVEMELSDAIADLGLYGVFSHCNAAEDDVDFKMEQYEDTPDLNLLLLVQLLKKVIRTRQTIAQHHGIEI